MLNNTRIGYACVNLTLPVKQRKLTKTKYLSLLQSDEKEAFAAAKAVSLGNIRGYQRLLPWHEEMGIGLLRISSDTIPLAGCIDLPWSTEWHQDLAILRELQELRRLSQKHQIRLSVHPGQYTVLNSPNETVVMAALAELEYHGLLCELSGITDIILHIGGVYGDKRSAKERFVQNFSRLSPLAQKLLRIENDDKTFHAQDAFDVANSLGIPVVFDLHHHRCHNLAGTSEWKENGMTEAFQTALGTWGDKRPKIHVSTGRTGETDRNHADYLSLIDFQTALELSQGTACDIMVESKAKDLAVLQLLKQLCS
ncbi:UV DNA damage repair endonuclease UvsE [Heliobacillus mobilis]|uniref:UV DNA damage repair endonuclease UvsE n=1 Tax=Heliobacterium mobile TaxID=28064 RepID=A0A6I3SIA9_HELMO|nr:UV DNA damage repair endonuclease UvsE [Heliobacterium mobile]MTV48546.1 UV DNA damage repair endonuclease UvsE [Heliobacterium mobile]